MNYRFKKYDINSLDIPKDKKEYEYSVDYSTLKDNEKALFHIGSHLWTPQKIQELIDDALALEDENDKLEYQVEGGHLGIIIFTDEVYFYDLLTDNEYEDFTWSFDTFIEFMKAFKKFIEDNS